MSHSVSAPLVLRHRMSDVPLPSKSPIPATDHDASGWIALPFNARCWVDTICDPSRLQSVSVPLLLRHRMSALPSPLKSPIPATVHDASGWIALPFSVGCWADAICAPFMLQSVSVPLLLRHRTSL